MASINFTMLGALGAVSNPIPTSGTLLFGGPTPYTIYFDGALTPGEAFTLANIGQPESSGIPVTYLGTDEDGGVYLSTGQYVYLVTDAAIETGDPYQYEAIAYLCFLAGTLIQTDQGEVRSGPSAPATWSWFGVAAPPGLSRFCGSVARKRASPQARTPAKPRPSSSPRGPLAATCPHATCA
jgi:hypothetical protein